ncbi:hypothetical protein GNP80_06460 [Aliivibrio fischeri]|uniref:hypothetical protein n=1 Tax=Aliivibrio fischeri TaxID=668 RepID=UPI0012D9BD8E|nr:hypothetical protein [Aliivibrio fischeri]MUK92081.1 hypothetical protein [Aliivibrio fischeri]
MKLLTSLLMVLWLSGCVSTNSDSVTALKVWDAKYKECQRITKNNHAMFPETDWFKSLSKEDKKAVVFYVNKLNDYNCGGKETESLRVALEKDNNESLIEFFESFRYQDKPDTTPIEHLDKKQIDLIESRFNKPFNLIEVGDKLQLLGN